MHATFGPTQPISSHFTLMSSNLDFQMTLTFSANFHWNTNTKKKILCKIWYLFNLDFDPMAVALKFDPNMV